MNVRRRCFIGKYLLRTFEFCDGQLHGLSGPDVLRISGKCEPGTEKPARPAGKPCSVSSLLRFLLSSDGFRASKIRRQWHRFSLNESTLLRSCEDLLATRHLNYKLFSRQNLAEETDESRFGQECAFAFSRFFARNAGIRPVAASKNS